MIAAPLRSWRDRAIADGHEVIESLSAFAEPAGLTTVRAHSVLRSEILDDLRKAGTVDVVLLSLHGAMAAEGCLDVEGDLLARIREMVGARTVIAVELDLHCQVTDQLLLNATLVVTYKEYPHVDILARAEEVYRLALMAAHGAVTPSMVYRPCNMNAYLPTTEEPMRGFVRSLSSREGRDGVLSISLAHGFPHGDRPGLGAGVLVVADRDGTGSERLARDLADQLWSMREALRPDYLSIDEAIDAASQYGEGPVVIADTSDNAGCGAAADSTYFLRRLVERGVKDVISALHWDPVAVRLCEEAGEGATIDLRIGGKIGPLSGAPIDLRCKILRIERDGWQTFNGFRTGIGSVVWLHSGGIDILINDKRFQVGAPDLMGNLGLNPVHRRTVVVKSTQHFYAGFAPIAKKILYAAGPGTSNPDTSRLRYVNVPQPLWPKPAGAV
jgi:microcystin degradation protein MlrC